MEEMYHAEQDRRGDCADLYSLEIIIRREIDAQNYLLQMAKKYKISVEETKVTELNLATYLAQLENSEGGKLSILAFLRTRIHQLSVSQ